jgi:hypothetical protein
VKPLSEMTIDEAIELACREVPECASKQRLTAIVKKACDCPTPSRLDVQGWHEAHRALWFDAAWEGLERLQDEKAGASVFFERGRWAVQAWKGKPGLGRTYQMPCRTYDTKYHAPRRGPPAGGGEGGALTLCPPSPPRT